MLRDIQQVNYHKAMSLFKSMVRIVGFIVLIVSIPIGVIILVVAEIIGILEEEGQ